MSSSSSEHEESVPGPSGVAIRSLSSIPSIHPRGDSSDDDCVDDPDFVPLSGSENDDQDVEDDKRKGEGRVAGISGASGDNSYDITSGVATSSGGRELQDGRRMRMPGSMLEKNGHARARQKEKWEKNIAKRKRNLGEEYTCYTTKKVMPAKEVGPPCNDGCFEKIGRANID